MVGHEIDDLDMFEPAGLSIAFNADPAVQLAADTTISNPYLDSVLFILGIHRSEVENADAEDYDFR